MRLFIIRHGIAEDSPAKLGLGAPDDYRELTLRGKGELSRQFTKLARQLNKIELIVSSPLVRARQTADILAEVATAAVRQESTLLRPECRADSVLNWVFTELCPAHSSVALVGHQPLLGSLVGTFLRFDNPVRVDMKKGTVAALEIDDFDRAQGATLKWYVTPKLMRDD